MFGLDPMGPFFISTDPLFTPQGRARDVTFSTDATEFKQCLARKDFERIIKSPQLFWNAYCQALYPHQLNSEKIYFGVSMLGNTIKFSGKAHIISKTEEIIESIRKIFENEFTKKTNFSFLTLHKSFDACYIVQDEPDLDIAGIDLHYIPQYSSNWFKNFVQRAIPQLVEYAGATLTEVDKSPHSKFEKIGSMSIKWDTNSHLVYPIPPIPVPELQGIREDYYSLYLNSTFCDLKLVTDEGSIDVHAIILYAHGGPVIKGMLVSGMKEAIDMSISLHDVSRQVVLSYLDFVYLGSTNFSEKAISLYNNDTISKLYDLFIFAHNYQVDVFINCCTNLICLMARKQDLEQIEHLAEFYDNTHLKQLAVYLSLMDTKSLIKV